jgi:hypothetical protein
LLMLMHITRKYNFLPFLVNLNQFKKAVRLLSARSRSSRPPLCGVQLLLPRSLNPKLAPILEYRPRDQQHRPSTYHYCPGAPRQPLNMNDILKMSLIINHHSSFLPFNH